MGYQARDGELPVDPEHAEDEAGQARLVQVETDTEVPAPDDTDVPPDIVTKDDGSGVAGGSGSSGGGSSMPGHPDATR
ncbi:preprotein translocase YidC [Micromonospora psammae]|uniref:preprotein translocase YidC n=1 Tax=Micromonospora sp. CPCC 205556 TaxID=3122398 RepID=UPI002FF088B3